MKKKYYSIHVFYSRNNGYSIPFVSEFEDEEQVINDAVKTGHLDKEDANSVDTVDEIDENEYKLMGGKM